MKKLLIYLLMICVGFTSCKKKSIEPEPIKQEQVINTYTLSMNFMSSQVFLYYNDVLNGFPSDKKVKTGDKITVVTAWNNQPNAYVRVWIYLDGIQRVFEETRVDSNGNVNELTVNYIVP